MAVGAGSIGIGFGAERLGLLALRFPRIAALCMAALLVLFGLSLTRLSFDDDMYRVFLSDSPLSQAQRAYEAAQSPPVSTALIHVTSQAAMDAEDMTALRNLSLDLEFIDGVTAVTSPFILRWPRTADAPSGTPVFPAEITDAFVDDLAAFDALGTGLPTFVNDGLTAVLLSVSVDTDRTAIPAAIAAIHAEIDRTLPQALAAHITGEDVIGAEIIAALQADLIALNLWGALIIAVAAIVVLRDLRMAVLAVVPALIGAAGVLALSVWIGYPITVLSNVIPILLLVLGVANGVHLAGHLKDHGAVDETIKAIGPACALTAITTAIAFAAITISGNAQLYEFGVLGAVGTMLSFAVVIATFALLARVMPLSDTPIPKLSGRFAVYLTGIATARPRATLGVCAVVLVLATTGFSQLTAWFPLYQNLPDNSATLTTNDEIARDFGGVFQMIVETGGDWSATRILAENLEATSPPNTVLSELTLARWLGDAEARPSPSDLETVPAALVSQIRDAGTSRIFIAMAEPMRNDATLAQFERVYATASDARSVIGLPTIMRQEAVSLIQQLSLGLIVAALGATLIVAAAFRSARLIPILILPNILPLMITGASLHLWAQGLLTPTAVLALTIAFGIAIDDTVHFLNRFSAAKAKGQAPVEAAASAAQSAGHVMVLTTLLLTAGLFVTLLSDFTPIRLFGAMMIVTLWAALLIDLLLLPALLTWRRAADDAG